MNPTFNLLDEPWIPVHFVDGETRDLGLLELFAQAHRIVSLAETAPPNLIALYRMLLAITHRALTMDCGAWRDSDRARWYRDGLLSNAFNAYLEHWRERFWLFHPEKPFMQVAALAMAPETKDKLKPWTQISLGSVSGDAPVMFDHSCDATPRPISPAAAVRELLGFLQFVPGGLVRCVRGSDKAGPLADTAAVLPYANTLQRVLCLPLHPRGNAVEDLPAWEKRPPNMDALKAQPALSSGPNDRYTRLTRAVLLLSEPTGVRWLHFAAGLAMEEDPNNPDPMASYRAGSKNLVRVSFDGGRAFWRDLPALLPDPSGRQAHPAAVLAWASTVHEQLGHWGATQPVLVAGLASRQAKPLRWRAEQINLPTVLFADPVKAVQVREAVGRAEQLHSSLNEILTAMLAESMPDPKSKDTRARARKILAEGPSAATYFTTAERALPELLAAIASDDESAYDQADAIWSDALLQAAHAALAAVLEGLGRTPRALRAAARAEPKWQRLLSTLHATPSPPNS